MERIRNALVKFLRVVIDDMEAGTYDVTPTSAMAILDAITGDYRHSADNDDERLAESLEKAYGYLCGDEAAIRQRTIFS